MNLPGFFPRKHSSRNSCLTTPVWILMRMPIPTLLIISVFMSSRFASVPVADLMTGLTVPSLILAKRLAGGVLVGIITWVQCVQTSVVGAAAVVIRVSLLMEFLSVGYILLATELKRAKTGRTASARSAFSLTPRVSSEWCHRRRRFQRRSIIRRRVIVVPIVGAFQVSITSIRLPPL